MNRQYPSLDGLWAPSVAVAFLLAAVGPFALTAALAMTDFSFSMPGRDGAWVGLSNFGRALDDPRFLSGLRSTLVFVSIVVPLEVGIGLSVALLLPHGKFGQACVVAITAPLLMSGVAVGVLWKLMLQGDFGVGTYLLRELGLLSGSVLASGTGAFLAIVVADLWQWAPFCVIVLYASRLALPEAPFMAARLDGASAWELIRDVTLPGLRSALLACTLFRCADAFREFDKVVVMTNGGPGSHTELLSLYIWNVSFVHGDIGYGSALTVIVFALVIGAINGALAILMRLR